MKHLSFFGHLPGLVLVCILLLALEACKPEDPAPVPVDCNTLRPNLGFTVSQNLRTSASDTTEVTDTFYYSFITGLTFSAKDRNKIDSVKWKIGQESRYRAGKRVYLEFSGPPFNDRKPDTIRVVCIQYHTDPCTKEPLVDTLTRNIFIFHLRDHMMIGQYRGRFSIAPNEDVLVEISDTGPSRLGTRDPTIYSSLVMRNFPYKCPYLGGVVTIPGTYSLLFDYNYHPLCEISSTMGVIPKAYPYGIYNPNTDSLFVRYVLLLNDDVNRLKWKFVYFRGKKI
jgi:hypothetical protein